MNKEEMEKIVNDIKDSLWYLENNKCNIDTKGNGLEIYYGLNYELIKYIRKIEQENKQLKERIDKYENPNDMTLYTMWCTEIVKDENQQLKYNWNKLKEYIKSDGISYLNFADERCFCNKKAAKYILNKMQELESGDSNADTDKKS